MKRFEYFTEVVDAKGFFGGKIDATRLNQRLNELGKEGWELVDKTASNQDFGSTRYIICVFKRELV